MLETHRLPKLMMKVVSCFSFELKLDYKFYENGMQTCW